MKTNIKILLVLVWCLIWNAWSSEVPVFEGKTMTAWMNLFMGAPEAEGKPRPTEQEQKQAVSAFQRMSSREFDYLIEQIESGQTDPRLIRYVFKAAGTNASSATPKLISLFSKGDDSTYWTTSECLAGIGTNSVTPLMEALTNSDSKIRMGAAYALGRIGASAQIAVPLLLERFKTEVIEVKAPIVSALGFIGGYSDHVVPVLIQALQSKDQGIRGNAAMAVGRYNDKVDLIAPILFKLLNDEDGRVRNNAVGSLFIMNLPKSYLPLLITNASNSDARVRCMIAQALGKQVASTNEVFPVLLKLTKDQDRYVRESAGVTINQMGYKPPVDVRVLRGL